MIVHTVRTESKDEYEVVSGILGVYSTYEKAKEVFNKEFDIEKTYES